MVEDDENSAQQISQVRTSERLHETEPKKQEGGFPRDGMGTQDLGIKVTLEAIPDRAVKKPLFKLVCTMEHREGATRGR